MNSAKTFGSIFLALAMGGAAAAGCIINVGEKDCSVCNAEQDPDALCHAGYSNAANECLCDGGYEWKNPNDPSDFECDSIPPKPGTSDCTEPNSYIQADQCFCDNGYNWCSDAADDLTCCVDQDQDSIGGTGTQATTSPGSATEPDPSGGGSSSGGDNPQDNLPECTMEIDGDSACTNSDENDLEGSAEFICTDGVWVENSLDEACVFENSDFSYGCFQDPADGSVNTCGVGPGTDCTAEDESCSNEITLQACIFGRLSDFDCDALCTDPEPPAVPDDQGNCNVETLECECCSGDACPA